MKTKATTIFLSCLAAFGLSSEAGAVEVVINVTSDPIESGSGPNLTGRYQNVATVNGTSVDLFGEVLSQTTNKTNDFWQGAPWALPGDFVFSFNDMVIGETRAATVRWSFYEAGTTIPVVFSEFSITVDDLDNVASGGDGRTETISSGDAASYTTDSSTNLAINNSGGELSATGGTNQNPGEAAGTITYHFANRSSFTMTYHTEPNGAVNSAFHHNGRGDFVFDDPVDTNLPVRLQYTYDFTNDENVPVTIAFVTALPAGITWDTAFTPQITGAFSGSTPQYSDHTIEIPELVLQPGQSSITFATLETTLSGTIEAEAKMAIIEPPGLTKDASATTIVLQ